MSVVCQFETILAYLGGAQRPLIEGMRLLDSHHILEVGLLESTSFTELKILGLVLQTSDLAGKPHEVIINISLNSEELSATCTCKAGSGKWKHIIGVMLKLRTLSLDELKSLSSTDIRQQWGKLAEASLRSYEPSRIVDFCHAKDKVLPYPPIPSDDEFYEEVQEEILQDMLKAFPDSTLKLTLEGMGSVPPENQPMEVDPDVAFAIVTSKCPSLLPLDAAGEITAECKDSEKEFFHAKVELSPEDAQALCVNTVTQWKSPLWRDARSFRITGANCYSLFTFGKKPRTPQDWERKACTIFQPSFRGSAATRYGLEKEEMARGIFQNCSKIKITQLGIVINIYNPWFGFSPDGIYFDPETNAGVLIEIKCPLLGKRMDGRELLKNLKFITEINGEQVKFLTSTLA